MVIEIPIFENDTSLHSIKEVTKSQGKRDFWKISSQLKASHRTNIITPKFFICLFYVYASMFVTPLRRN